MEIHRTSDRESIHNSQSLDELVRETELMNRRLGVFSRWVEQMRMRDVLQNYGKPSRVIWINFLAGLARGLGLTLGTAIVLSLLSILLSTLADFPFLTDTIRNLKSIVDHSSS